MCAILITHHIRHLPGNWAAAWAGRSGRDIIARAAPSLSRLTFPLKLFIYDTEWMCGGQGKLAVNQHCQHCCLSATGNWQLYFCSHGSHSLSLLSVILTFCFSFRLFPRCPSLQSCLFSLANSCGLMPHTLFWHPPFASLTPYTNTPIYSCHWWIYLKHSCELNLMWKDQMFCLFF